MRYESECFVWIYCLCCMYRAQTVQISCSYRVGFVYKQYMNVEDCVLKLQMFGRECMVLKIECSVRNDAVW